MNVAIESKDDLYSIIVFLSMFPYFCQNYRIFSYTPSIQIKKFLTTVGDIFVASRKCSTGPSEAVFTLNRMCFCVVGLIVFSHSFIT